MDSRRMKIPMQLLVRILNITCNC